jgi:thiol-disulfide isomerase/thioredoxin
MVEFWATWCGPCIASMPHVTELQKKYGAQGLTVIGVSGVDKNGNTLEKAVAMVADKGDTMGYTVAWDKDRETNAAFMKAAEQGGIPCSFLIDQNGDIAYIGHPAKIDDTLELVMSKKHDIKALAASYKKQAAIEAQANEIQTSMQAAGQKEDWAGVLAAMDKLVALDPVEYGGYVAGKFQVTAFQMKDPAKAYADAKSWFSAAKDPSVDALNGIAWTIVDPSNELENRDAEFALKLAQKANELTKNENPSILDTVARAHFLKGDIAKAVEIETLAVEKSASNKKQQKSLQKQLDEYKEELAKKAKG